MEKNYFEKWFPFTITIFYFHILNATAGDINVKLVFRLMLWLGKNCTARYWSFLLLLVHQKGGEKFFAPAKALCKVALVDDLWRDVKEGLIRAVHWRKCITLGAANIFFKLPVALVWLSLSLSPYTEGGYFQHIFTSEWKTNFNLSKKLIESIMCFLAVTLHKGKTSVNVRDKTKNL